MRNWSFLAICSVFALCNAQAANIACDPSAYLDAPGGLVLKSAPSESASDVAQLQDRQYLCVIRDDLEDGWIRVVAVPHEGFCMDGGSTCKDPIKGQPIKWLSPAPKTACLLEQRLDEGDMPISEATEGCATGWATEKQIQYFAN